MQIFFNSSPCLCLCRTSNDHQITKHIFHEINAYVHQTRPPRFRCRRDAGLSGTGRGHWRSWVVEDKSQAPNGDGLYTTMKVTGAGLPIPGILPPSGTPGPGNGGTRSELANARERVSCESRHGWSLPASRITTAGEMSLMTIGITAEYTRPLRWTQQAGSASSTRFIMSLKPGPNPRTRASHGVRHEQRPTKKLCTEKTKPGRTNPGRPSRSTSLV